MDFAVGDAVMPDSSGGNDAPSTPIAVVPPPAIPTTPKVLNNGDDSFAPKRVVKKRPNLAVRLINAFTALFSRIENRLQYLASLLIDRNPALIQVSPVVRSICRILCMFRHVLIF